MHSIRDVVRNAWNGFLNLLFPARTRCLLCGTETEGTYLCQVCEGKVSIIDGVPRCSRCSRPLIAEERFCPSCSRGEKIHFDRAVAPCTYDGIIVNMIRSFKFKRRSDYAHYFAELMFGASRLLPAFDVVVPVPTKASTLRQRGYNQCDLLGKSLCSHLKVPFCTVLKRTDDAREQVGLTGEERRRNVEGTVKVVNGNAVSGKRVLVVDDVLTTGATVSECARVLKRAGALDVYAIAVAIAPTKVLNGETGEITSV